MTTSVGDKAQTRTARPSYRFIKHWASLSWGPYWLCKPFDSHCGFCWLHRYSDPLWRCHRRDVLSHISCRASEFLFLPAQRSAQSNYNSTNLPTSGTPFYPENPEYARENQPWRIYLQRCRVTPLRQPTPIWGFLKGNFTNYLANSNTLLHVNTFQIPQACPWGWGERGWRWKEFLWVKQPFLLLSEEQ